MNQVAYKMQNGRSLLIEFDGNSALLYLNKVGFISSAISYQRLTEVLERWVKIVKREGKAIVSGFHSSVEKQVLSLALREKIPVIVAKETCLTEHIPNELYEPYQNGNLTFISIFNSNVTKPSSATGYIRNKLVIDLCPEVTVGSVRPKGTVDALINEHPNRNFLNLENLIYNK